MLCAKKNHHLCRASARIRTRSAANKSAAAVVVVEEEPFFALCLARLLLLLTKRPGGRWTRRSARSLPRAKRAPAER